MIPVPANIKFVQLPTMPDPCWEWQLHRSANGYGIIKLKGKNEYVHRLFYRIFNGPLHGATTVLHRCDNKPCCNPSHLRKGTAADNIADCKAKGRHSYGTKQRTAKLTDKRVLDIRTEYASGSTSQHKLARKYGVSRTTLRNAMYGKSWNHVEGALCPRPR